MPLQDRKYYNTLLNPPEAGALQNVPAGVDVEAPLRNAHSQLQTEHKGVQSDHDGSDSGNASDSNEGVSTEHSDEDSDSSSSRASGSTRSNIESPLPEPQEQAPPAELQARTQTRKSSMQNLSEGNFDWGPFLFTWKRQGRSARSSWQATCKIPGHDKCTRTRSVGAEGDFDCAASLLLVRKLKHWLVCPAVAKTFDGKDIVDKSTHMGMPSDYGYDLPFTDEQLEDQICIVFLLHPSATNVRVCDCYTGTHAERAADIFR